MSRRAWLWLIGVPTGVLGLVMAGLAAPMWDAGGPDIVWFELAWSQERASEILLEWDGDARDAARLSLWLDFLYLAGYGAFWALAARAMRDRALDAGWERLGRAGRFAAVAAPLAAACDAGENVALLVVLEGRAVDVGPPVAAFFASVKFALIGFSVLFVLVVLARRHRRVAVALAVAVLALVVVTVVVEERRTESGARPHLVVDGERGRPPLVLIHGYSVDHHWWDPLIPHLEAEHRIVRVDLRGHGRSEKPRDGYSMEEQADFVAAGVRRAGVRDATIVGHSMGGAVAIAFAERHPGLAARVMIIGTGPDVGQEHELSYQTPAFLPVTGHLLRAFAPRTWIRHGYERGLDPRIDLSPAMASAPDRLTWRAWNAPGTTMSDYTKASPLDERAARIDKPFAAVFGTDDEEGERADRYRRIRGARVVELPGLGHSPQVERPDLVARLVMDFGQSP